MVYMVPPRVPVAFTIQQIRFFLWHVSRLRCAKSFLNWYPCRGSSSQLGTAAGSCALRQHHDVSRNGKREL